MESKRINSETNKAYVLDLNMLEEGDIILESGTSKFSYYIKKGTNSEYSHAMLYVGHSIIHALTDGVYSANPQRILVDSKSDLKVLRLKSKDTITIKNIVDNARQLVGSLYSKSEAIKSQIKKNTEARSKTSAQYCSKLVANVYDIAGVSIVKNPDYCSPEDISNSELLDEIKDCVREAKKEDIEFSKSRNPILENQKSAFKYLSDCREVFKKVNIDIQSEADVGLALIKHKEFDTVVCSYIEDSGYLEHYDSDEHINHYRYDVDLFIERYGLSSSESEQILISEYGSLSSIIERHIKNLSASKQMYAQTKLEYYQLSIDLYKNILLSSRKWLYTLHQFSKKVGDKDFFLFSLKLLKYIDSQIA